MLTYLAEIALTIIKIGLIHTVQNPICEVLYMVMRILQAFPIPLPLLLYIHDRMHMHGLSFARL